MNDQEQKEFINAWTAAAKDLGLVIRPWFSILTDNGQTAQCALLIENFGGKLGTAIFTDILKSPDPSFSSKGYFVAILPFGHLEYDRNYFIDILNDWGYFGDPKLKPNWFTGHYWGQKK